MRPLRRVPVRAAPVGSIDAYRAVRAGTGAATLLVAVALTAPAAVRADAASNEADARSDAQWLQTIQDAARRLNYSGTIVYHHGDEVHASRVVQSYDGTESRERVLTLDGQQREFIRQGDEVQCLYPNLHRIVVQHGGAHAFPAFADAAPAEVLAHYALQREGTTRVAGNECDVVKLVPRDKMRYGYRLCVHPVNGLLFKAQTLGDQDAVLEEMAFTDVRVGEPINPAQLKPSWRTDGWSVVRLESEPAAPRQQTWSVTPPSGFHRLAQMMRRLTGAGDPAPRSAYQAVYSDGLATVSVFIEPGAPTLEEAAESQRNGSVTAFSRQVGDARVTVVGEVPPSTAKSIAESVVRTSSP
jgi:sigma-E factor negative regulatory protein RseB